MCCIVHQIYQETILLMKNAGFTNHTCLHFQNLTFQAEQRVKSQVVDAMGREQLFRLLSDPDPDIVLKTLGLLRNLLTNKLVRLKYLATF